MTITVDQFLTDQPDPLIKSGQYQIVPTNGEKAKGHTRITNFAKKLEDEYNLQLWKLRQVMLGTAQRSDIQVAALANSDNKKALNRLAEDALDASHSNVKRETGTALHRIIERVDSGETLDLPSPWREDVIAYVDCLATLGAEVELIEEVVVCPRLGLAGRLDRTVLIPSRYAPIMNNPNAHQKRYICDLKTGADLSYSWGSIAMQLALYAGAETIYDPQTKQHRPMVACDQSQALVIHLPAGKGEATPYWVNIEAGRRGIALVSDVLEWRKGAKMLATHGAPKPEPVAASYETREYVANHIRFVVKAGHGDELVNKWPEGIQTLKAYDHHTEPMLNEILAVCAAIEGRHKMPFPEFNDPRGMGKF